MTIKIYDISCDAMRDATQADLNTAMLSAQSAAMLRSIIRKLDPLADREDGKPINWEAHVKKVHEVLQFIDRDK